MLRITSSKVVPYAVGAISSRRALSGWITNAINACPIIANFHGFFSTDAKKQIDTKLLKIIKSEIKLKQAFILDDITEFFLPDYPFTIKSDPREEHVTFSRDFDGEKIDVVVRMPCCSNVLQKAHVDSADDSNSDADVISANDGFKPDLRLKVKISKARGVISEFDVSVHVDGAIRVYKNALREEPSGRRFGPHYPEEEGELQNALKEYLKIRGIKRLNNTFIFEHMVQRYVNAPKAALRKLGDFIADK